VTDHGGVVGFESVDGKSLYYTKENDICGIPLFARSLAGGAERRVVDQVCARAFQVTEKGIYYLSGKGVSYLYRPTPADKLTIHLFDPASGVSREIRQLAGRLYAPTRLTVSRDGSSFLLAGPAGAGSDLYLVENFR